MVSPSSDDLRNMQQALRLAARGQGRVEPNPMVGCVVAQRRQETSGGCQVVGEGWHERFGGPHAEVNALRAAGAAATGATLYVTLEPCCHHGKTPPCTDALIDAGIARVVIAQHDPYGEVKGRGIQRLRDAGLQVEVGLLESDAKRLNAPYLKLLKLRLPWIIAKWAMTLDGKIATHTGHSQWISSPASRQIVHQVRGRVDAIMVGSQTAHADNPSLTARPPGPRTPARVVVDSAASLSATSQLATTARTVPVIVAVGSDADPVNCDRLRDLGCEILVCQGDDRPQRVRSLLIQMGQRRWTNVLVEGGGRLLGNLLHMNQIDEVHAFIAPKLVGGAEASSPIEGVGLNTIDQAVRLDGPQVQTLGDDVYVSGPVLRSDVESSESD